MVTIKVVSSESGGEREEIKTDFDTKQEAENAIKMCKELFIHHTKGGVGDLTHEYDSEQGDRIILEYLKKNSDIKFFEDQKDLDDYELVQYTLEIMEDLMGYSDYHYSRVAESVEMLETWDDIFEKQAKIGANYHLLIDFLKENYKTPEEK
jgi:hypothetical protein